MLKKLSVNFLLLLGSIIIVTIFCLLVSLSVQQNFRMSANDPQIQLAEDTANALNNHQPAVSLLGSSKVDVAKSLAPFLIIYDEGGNSVDSTGFLDNQIPTLPNGVFQSVKTSGEKRFTWQPKTGVRIAAVVTKSNSGFVLAGRSLREVEVREDKLNTYVLLAWFAGIITILICFFLTSFLKSKHYFH